MKKVVLRVEPGAKPGGKQKPKLLKESKLFVARSLRTLFSRIRSQSDYIYENTSSYEKSVKKQGEVKSLKITGLSSYGSAVRRKKMLKMKDDPTMCMKTQDRATECPSRRNGVRNRFFSPHGFGERFQAPFSCHRWFSSVPPWCDRVSGRGNAARELTPSPSGAWPLPSSPRGRG
jgi:hypothetical protein